MAVVKKFVKNIDDKKRILAICFVKENLADLFIYGSFQDRMREVMDKEKPELEKMFKELGIQLGRGELIKIDKVRMNGKFLYYLSLAEILIDDSLAPKQFMFIGANNAIGIINSLAEKRKDHYSKKASYSVLGHHTGRKLLKDIGYEEVQKNGANEKKENEGFFKKICKWF